MVDRIIALIVALQFYFTHLNMAIPDGAQRARWASRWCAAALTAEMPWALPIPRASPKYAEQKRAKGVGDERPPCSCGFPDCAKAADDISGDFIDPWGDMHQVQAVVPKSNLRGYVIGKFVLFAEAALPTAIPAIAMLTI